MKVCRAVVATAALLIYGTGDSAADDAGIVLRILSPRPEAVVGDPDGLVFLEGRVLAPMGPYRTHDIVFVVDTSEATAASSGLDIDGDGEVRARPGRSIFSRKRGSGDSILAMQVAAVKAVLAGLDPREARVGVVAFPGLPEAGDFGALTEVALTPDFEEVRQGLDRILEIGAAGAPNVAAAVALAGNELIGAGRARSTSRKRAKRVIAFFAGSPLLPPVGSGPPGPDFEVGTSQIAAERGIRIDTFAMSARAIAAPGPLTRMASVSGGTYTPVRGLGVVKLELDEVRFADVSLLRVRNATSGGRSIAAQQSPDGRFAAMVPLRVGENVLEVRARTVNGKEARSSVLVTYEPGAPSHPLTPPQQRRRAELLDALD